MSSIPLGIRAVTDLLGYRQGISVGPRTAFTSISVKCEIGKCRQCPRRRVVDCLKGYRQRKFCKTGESLRMSCSILKRSVGNVVNISRSKAVTENGVSSRELHGAPNGLEIITSTCGYGKCRQYPRNRVVTDFWGIVKGFS